ncbi:Protein FRA10AC1, putative [Perkinsus marinus ATCC 50983]|uniref:Protein FRA10AC1, putative n=1 Tax=Perkinsus marinus (strain ATCC 50983 / TXsc) TaxID=423536 RepID=C5LWJ0_PERM5|nr:Protein FRA10AC1, putative [Perkinsus marinus ATCC 50983]EEQ98903.1 Protein FRA10AC1, putative [Perkinsus marinus ATCC 50983]|eukprot:XP_002766186.1 Protein FRA10AC1, putative [Perkinsus marinus ATCC 50983]
MMSVYSTWQFEQVVAIITGLNGCANMRCNSTQHLRTFEVDFSYKEHGERKRELVKVRLCYQCSIKLNWKWIRRAKKKGREFRIKKDEEENEEDDTVIDITEEDSRVKEEPVEGGEDADDVDENDKEALKVLEERMWRNDGQAGVDNGEEKRANEFEDYFNELFQ